SRIPYYVMGNRQDGPSSRGPSNSKLAAFGGGGGGEPAGPGPIPRGEWHSVAGGESGWATPDPEDPDVIWSSASGSGSVGGIVVRYDERTRQAQHVEIWPQSTIGSPAADVKYRFVWTFPLTISPHDHNRVYAGSQFVHLTTDGGRSWQEISPDLTLNDKSRQQISGGLTPDNIGVEYGDAIFAIAESPLKPGLIWAGTNDGLVHVTRDAGKSWTAVGANIPGLPPWGTVSNVEPSRYDTGAAYITVDLHQVNNRDPYVYKTADYGRTWTPIVNGIPKSPLSYAHVVREDPVRRGLLYLGTQNALYGAALSYWLKEAPKDSVTITIADAAGQTVRTLHGAKSGGINRVWWDLRNEQTREARLRTAPLYAPEAQPSPDSGRAAPGIGRLAVLMPPGTYTVKLKVGDQELTQPLEVRKDPTSGGSPEEIRTQVKLLVDLQGDLNRAVDMINQIE